jgi:hypothetical protein
MNDLNQYFNRIEPIVGDHLRNKSLAIFNPSTSCLAADALARCGLRKQIYFLSSEITCNNPIYFNYRRSNIGLFSGEALKKEIIEHNRLETDWQIEVRKEEDPGDIIAILEDKKVDLLIGGGDLKTCFFINELSVKTNIPAVIFNIFYGSPLNSFIYISHPSMLNDFSEFWNIIQLNNKSTNDYENHYLKWLEAIDLVMNFSKALLLRGSKHEREDLEEIIFEQKRNLVLRGSNKWPWWIYYVNISEKVDFLKELFSSHYYILPPPTMLLEDKKVMVLGCGTASLLTRELVNCFKNILLLDYKKFSIYNPVRQLIGTDWVEKDLKPFALQQYLGEQLHLESNKLTEGDLLKDLSNEDYSISASELCLKGDDKNSVRKFNELLDYFEPDVVVVGMGRTYDDNFTACEILRKRKIKHIIPSAFPGATHFKVIVVDGEKTPCYECLQNNLRVDVGPVVDLNEESREMFYTNPSDPTQPATIFETWPSVHLLLSLTVELCLDDKFRSKWFRDCLNLEKTCFVGGNISVKDNGAYAYGIKYPGQVVVYGVHDITRTDDEFTCLVCGKHHKVNNKINYK